MRIPKTITIDGATFTIKYKRDLVDEDGKSVLGMCLFDQRIIWIEQNQSLEAKRSTFIHEALHAMIGDNLSVLIDDEELVKFLEGPLFRFLMSNGPALFSSKPRKPRAPKVATPPAPQEPKP